MNKQQCDKIRELLVAGRAGQFDFLSALVRQPSDNPPGEFQDIIDHLMSQFRKLGFSILRHPDPVGHENGDDGTDNNGLTNLIVRHKFGKGPIVAFVANVDTAKAGGDWTHDPYGGDIVERHMYGRGVSGAKGTLAAYVFALLALRECASDLMGTIELHITFDGETGGDQGPRWLLANKLVAPDFAIAPGPADCLVTSACGRLFLEVEINGRAAVASNPGAGIDTLDAAARVMSAIYNLRPHYAEITSDIEGIGSPTAIVTEVSGGESPRHIAAKTIVKIDRRILPEENPVKVERELTTLIGKNVVQVKDMLCKVRRTYQTPAMLPQKGTDCLIDAFQRQASDVFGAPLPVIGTALET